MINRIACVTVKSNCSQKSLLILSTASILGFELLIDDYGT